MDLIWVRVVTIFTTIIVFAYIIYYFYRYRVQAEKKIKVLKAKINNNNLSKKKSEKIQNRIKKIQNRSLIIEIENKEKSKRFCLLLLRFLTVFSTNLLYLFYFKYFSNRKKPEVDVSSIIVLTCMFLTSFVTHVFKKKGKRNEQSEKACICEVSSSKVSSSFEITCSYIISTILIISSNIIMGLYAAAISWGLILTGKFVWFDTYDLFEVDTVKLKKLFKDKNYQLIVAIPSTLYLITIFSLEMKMTLCSEIMRTLCITLFFVGILTTLTGRICLEKKDKGGCNPHTH